MIGNTGGLISASERMIVAIDTGIPRKINWIKVRVNNSRVSFCSFSYTVVITYYRKIDLEN